MKLMYCQDCASLVVPNPTNGLTVTCRCGRHSVWWENSFLGVLRLHDHSFKPIETRKGSYYEFAPPVPRAYVIGLSNLIFGFPGSMDAPGVQELIDAHEDSYLFKRWRSLVIRIRPGESGDTSWAKLPY